MLTAPLTVSPPRGRTARPPRSDGRRRRDRALRASFASRDAGAPIGAARRSRAYALPVSRLITPIGRTISVRHRSFALRRTTHTAGMAETWAPSLNLRERGEGRCRLTLVGLTHGDGDTLQAAADDLVARLLDIVAFVRTAGFPVSADLPAPDHRLMHFVWQLCERVARGEDIRELVLRGPVSLTSI